MGMSPAAFAMSELSKIVQRCNPDFDSGRAISWQFEAGSVAESWRQWMEDLFEPLILPHLWRVVDFSARQSAREIILLDAELHRSMQPWPRQQSIDAGRTLLRQSTPRGERVMARLREAILCGAAFGHFATLYGVRCGAFSIPVRTAILGYLVQELAAGAPEEIGRVKLLEASVESVNEFLRISSIGLSEGLRFHG
jgi:UreF-like urease accessory protein